MTWDISGHEWAARLLKQHIMSGEVRHAYLFTGPSGVGRRTLALQFAQALNRLQPPAPGEFCGQCRVCRQTAAMQHSDLTITQSEKEGGMLKVEAIREAQRSLSLLPYEAKYRVALLLRFHEANANAQNALLKTLEEAPKRVILLLTAELAESLLPTCFALRGAALASHAAGSLQQVLEKRGVASAEDARLLAHLSSGRLGYALRLKDDPGRLEQRRASIDDLLNMLEANRRDRFTYAELIARDRDALRETYRVWLSFWRDLLLHCASPDLPLTNLDMQAEINSLAWKVDLATARAQVAAL